MNKKDWNAAFPETPDIIHRAVSRGFLEGQRRERKRRRLTQGMALAATLVVMLGMGLLMRQASLKPRQDILSQGSSAQPGAEFTPPVEQAQTVPATTLPPLDVTVAPTAEPTVAPTEDAEEDVSYAVNEEDSVRFRENDLYFHATSECELAMDDSGTPLRLETRAQAEEMGLYPCPVCLFEAGKAYVREGEALYHRDPFCGEGAAVRPVTLLEALQDDRTACAACTGVQQVAMTESNIYYHTQEDCSQLSGDKAFVTWMPEDQALLAGRVLCAMCTGASYRDVSEEDWLMLAAAGQICAYRVSGGWHLDAECAGEEAEWILLGQALREGLVHCAECVRVNNSPINYMDAYSERLGDYYFTEGGTYYHTLPECSGMRNATPHTLALALTSRKQPCPVCFPYDPTSQDSVRRYSMILFGMCFGAECPLENVMTESTTSARGMQDECILRYGEVSYATVTPKDGVYLEATKEGLSLALSMSEENAQAMQDFLAVWQNSSLVAAYDAAYAKVNEGSNTTCSLQSVSVQASLDESRHLPTVNDCSFSFLMQNPDNGFKIGVSVDYSIDNQRIRSMNWGY